MNPLLAFLKNKATEFEGKENSELKIEIENFATKNNISMAKSAQSLNVLQTLRVYDHLNDFSNLVSNPLKEEGYKFKDGSIILNETGRLNGLTIEESSLWENGIYFKPKIEVSIIEEFNMSANISLNRQEDMPSPRRKLSL